MNRHTEPIADRLLAGSLALCAIVALGWLLTHDGCAHPVSNIIALAVWVTAGTMLLLPHAIAWFERNTPETDSKEQ